LTKTNDTRVEAILLRTKWVEGKAIQENIKYLSSIRLGRIQWPYPRKEFWLKVWRALDALALPLEERMRIEEKLQKLVPQPPK